MLLVPFIAVYFLLFSTGLTYGLVWVLERGEKKYRLGVNYSSPIFLWASMLFILSYLSNFAFLYTGHAFLFWQLCQLTGLITFGWLKEKYYKDRVFQQAMKISDEINRLKEVMAHDPANISCHERLSEIYEEQGNWAEAERHAQAACNMNPSELNKWRVKTLHRDIENTIKKKQDK